MNFFKKKKEKKRCLGIPPEHKWSNGNIYYSFSSFPVGASNHTLEAGSETKPQSLFLELGSVLVKLVQSRDY